MSHAFDTIGQPSPDPSDAWAPAPGPVVLPSDVPGRGERALMCAVLAEAIHCLSARSGPARMRLRLAAQARVWIRASDRRWPFSFLNICDELGLEPDDLRRRVLGPRR